MVNSHERMNEFKMKGKEILKMDLNKINNYKNKKRRMYLHPLMCGTILSPTLLPLTTAYAVTDTASIEPLTQESEKNNLESSVTMDSTNTE